MKKNWTIAEDEILCKFCIEKYVKQNSYESVESLIMYCMTRPEFTGRGRGSIRMRIQNIRAVLDSHKIQNSIPLTPLTNFAEQTESIVLNLLRENS